MYCITKLRWLAYTLHHRVFDIYILPSSVATHFRYDKLRSDNFTAWKVEAFWKSVNMSQRYKRISKLNEKIANCSNSFVARFSQVKS